MSNHIQATCGNIKTNAALSNTAKLLRAYMECSGIHCAKTISENLGINLRTIYRLKLDIAASCATDGTATSANTATDGTIETATCATRGTAHARIDNIITTNQVKCSEVKESKSLSLSRPKGEAHGTRLPADWKPSHDLHQWTRTTFPQTTEDRVATELETFHDYWASVPGQKGRKADWNATWRVWSKRAFATAPIRPMSQPPPSANGKSSTVAEALAKRRAAAEIGAVQ